MENMEKNSETNSEDLTTFPAGETAENSAAAATPAAIADTPNTANSTDSKIPYAADKSDAKSERHSAPLDPQSSATSELAALLSVEQEINAADIKEKEIKLSSEAGTAQTHWSVVLPALAAISAVIIWGLGFPQHFSNFAGSTFTWILDNVGWAFILFSTVFVIFIFTVAFSKFGSIRLGAVDEQPEFTTKSWISMMFAAGMGIGMMFFGAAEPLAFYRDGIPMHGAKEVGTAMAQTIFHWGLHPWAIYAVLALAIAYSTYRVGRRQLISAAFTPLIGEKYANGRVGKFIDSLSIFVTVFGTASSLGVGTLQIRAGLEASGLVKNPGTALIVGVVSVLTLAFLLSAMSGVGKGVRIISNANMVLASALAIIVFVLGPTVAQLNMLPNTLGNYIQNFFEMASRTGTSADGSAGEWLSSWTLFYWVWWMSWSPFVGMFLARISRGRSVREFCLGVLLVPTGVSVIWFSIFGGTAIWMEQHGKSIYGSGMAEEQLFNLLHNLPGGYVWGIIALILLATFFITSADSASTVMGSISQGGRTNATPAVSGLWGVMTALIGLTMLISGGNAALSNIQNVTIVVASPFLLILIGLMFAIVKDMRNDVIYLDSREQEKFARQLAIERRHLREQAERAAQQAKRKGIKRIHLPRAQRIRKEK